MTSVTLTRTAAGEYDVTNARGGVVHLSSNESTDFGPVELLLAALAGCSAVDVDLVTTRHSDPVQFEAVASGTKVTEGGNHLEDVEVTFRVRFGDGPEADRARTLIPRALKIAHERDCTVSRSLELPTPVRFTQA